MARARARLPALVALLWSLPACAARPTVIAPPPAAAGEAPGEGLGGEEPGDAAVFDARLSGYPYPFEVRFLETRAQGQDLELAYMDVGPRDAEAGTVLLLHGKNFSGAYWAETAEALVARGHRVVIPDQVGFGKSSKPVPFQYSFSDMVSRTVELLDELGVDEVAVVGHSMGGMVATRFALMHPERTARLALVNPIGLEDWQRVVPYATVDALYEAALAKTPESVEAYMQESYFDGHWEPRYDAVAELQAGWSEGPDEERLAWVDALTADMIFTQPVVHDLGRLEVPTLLVIGTRDRTALGKGRVSPEVRAELGRYDRLGQAARDAMPEGLATLVELDGVGHMPQVEAFEDMMAALGPFLSGE